MQKFLSPFPAATTSTPSMVILGHKNLFTSAMIWLCTAFELFAVLSTRGKNQKAKHLCVPNIFYFLCKNMLFVYKQNLFKIPFLNYIFFPPFFSVCRDPLCPCSLCLFFHTLTLSRLLLHNLCAQGNPWRSFVALSVFGWENFYHMHDDVCMCVLTTISQRVCVRVFNSWSVSVREIVNLV